MPYDKNFYRLYRNYLKEPIVRKNHRHVFELFAQLSFPKMPSVMDLGCGIGEYALYDRRHLEYVGIDVNNTGKLKNFVQADYTTLDFMTRLPFIPNAFVSLFSIECCQKPEIKYALYADIFKKFEKIKYGLAGGFFYESKRGQETVSEAGEIVSYQTIEDPLLYINDIFTEMRICLHTPSKMFGQDVIEVWKLFVRKAK